MEPPIGSDDEQEYEAMFRRHYAAVSRYALRRAPADGAGDAVAETFLLAWRTFDRRPANELAWLLAVARRVIANQWRAERRRGALRGRLATTSWQARPGVPSAEGDKALAVALRHLPEHQLEALLLVAWDGLDSRSAAHVVGCSPATFRVRLHRARRRLAGALRADTVEQGGRGPATDMAKETR